MSKPSSSCKNLGELFSGNQNVGCARLRMRQRTDSEDEREIDNVGEEEPKSREEMK
jgi:hypothetical protein